MQTTVVEEDPAFVTALIENVHMVRWLHTPTVFEVRAVSKDVDRAYRTVGGPLVCVAVVPAGVDPPTDHARQLMMEELERLMKVSRAVHFVIEGSGFRHVMLRSVVTGLIMVAGRRGRILVNASLEEALRAESPAHVKNVPSMLAAAVAKGIVR